MKQSLMRREVDFTRMLPSFARTYFENKYRLTAKQKAYMFRQLSYLVESGYSIELTLRKIQGKEGTSWHKAVIKMIWVVRDTGSLADALAALHLFSPEVLYQVEGGEMSGELPTALMEISRAFESDASVSRKMRVMLIYPVMLLMVLFTVMYIISTFIMPQIMGLVNELDAPLSLLSRIVIALADTIATRGHWLLMILVLAVVATVYAVKQTPVGRLVDRLALKIGFSKDITRMTELAKYCRVFHSLYRSGVGLEASMDCAAKTVRNTVLKQGTMHSKQLVIKDGVDFAEALAASGLFDETEVQLIDIGAGVSEEKMCEAFEAMANRTVQELETQIKTMMSILEPVSILVVGILVGLFVVGIYSPVFSIIYSM